MKGMVKGKITRPITLNAALRAVKREFRTLSRDLQRVGPLRQRTDKASSKVTRPRSVNGTYTFIMPATKTCGVKFEVRRFGMERQYTATTRG